MAMDLKAELIRYKKRFLPDAKKNNNGGGNKEKPNLEQDQTIHRLQAEVEGTFSSPPHCSSLKSYLTVPLRL